MTQLLDLRCYLFHRLSAHPRTGPDGTFQQCFGSDGMSCGRSVRSRVQFPPLEQVPPARGGWAFYREKGVKNPQFRTVDFYDWGCWFRKLPHPRFFQPPQEVPFTDSERDFLLWESRIARRRDGKGNG